MPDALAEARLHGVRQRLLSVSSLASWWLRRIVALRWLFCGFDLVVFKSVLICLFNILNFLIESRIKVYKWLFN